jgi:two-component system chemotaxis sensor kinase CheA
VAAAPGSLTASAALQAPATNGGTDPTSPPAPRTPTAAADHSKPSNAESGSIRVGTDKVDELINTVGELVITQAMLSELGRGFEGTGADLLRSGLAQLERNMRQLQESVMRVRMLPISVAFSRFPRMVHDLALRLGKKIDLKLAGEQTELDKTVLEKIGDPLVHLVRNSIDHGIETPDVRTANGKPPFGTVSLNAYHSGGSIVVEVSDDGAGLDVSMDVVRARVKELGGSVEIRSQRGRGSRFLITLPLTLAIVDGQSVLVGSECYIVPLTSIVESLQLKAQNVNHLCGAGELFSFRGDYLPLVRLHELFGIEPRSRGLQDGLVVVAEGDGRRIGLFVDELLGQQQVVIKSMETNYGRVAGVAGATILGDGSVALILDMSGLIRSAAVRVAA